MYRAHDFPDDNGLRDASNVQQKSMVPTVSVAITAFPAHLAYGTVHLLAGKSEDDLVRVLFLPRIGPPEVKQLRVTLNHILAKLEESASAVDSYRERRVMAEANVLSAIEDQPGTSDAALAESSDVELEETAISADGDGLGSHESDIAEVSDTEAVVD